MKIIQTLLNACLIKGVEYYTLAVKRFWNTFGFHLKHRLGVCACVCVVRTADSRNSDRTWRLYWSGGPTSRRRTYKLAWLADAAVPPVKCKTSWFQRFMHAELKRFRFPFPPWLTWAAWRVKQASVTHRDTGLPRSFFSPADVHRGTEMSSMCANIRQMVPWASQRGLLYVHGYARIAVMRWQHK